MPALHIHVGPATDDPSLQTNPADASTAEAAGAVLKMAACTSSNTTQASALQALNTVVKCTPLALTLGAAPLLKAANMRAIAKFVGTAKGDVLLSSYANVAKGQAHLTHEPAHGE